MGRRLLLNRSLNETMAESASSEGAVTPGKATAVSVDGKLDVVPGGHPTTSKSLSIVICKSGNLGTAQFALCEDPDVDTTCYGVAGPQVIERAGELDPSSALTTFLPATPVVYDRRNQVVYAFYRREQVSDVDLWYVRKLTVSTMAWSAATQFHDGAYALEPGAAMLHEDTGELVFMAGGKVLVNCDPSSDLSAWSELGEYDYNASAECLQLFSLRDRMVLMYLNEDGINPVQAKAIVSYDRGSTWESEIDIAVPLLASDKDAYSLSVAVHPNKEFACLAVLMDVGSDRLVTLSKTYDGEVLDLIDADLDDISSLALRTYQCVSIAFEQTGQLLFFGGYAEDAPLTGDGLCVCRYSGVDPIETESQSLDRIRILSRRDLIRMEDLDSSSIQSATAIDIGSQILILATFGDGASTSTIWATTRRWSSHAWNSSADELGYVTSSNHAPSDVGFTAATTGSGAPTKGASYLTLTSPDVTADAIKYGQIDAGVDPPGFVRMRMKADANWDADDSIVGVQMTLVNGSDGYHFFVWIGADGIRIEDVVDSSTSSLYAASLAATFHEFVIEVVRDGGPISGHALRVWVRDNEADGYPYSAWTLLVDTVVVNGNTGGSSNVRFGNWQNAGASSDPAVSYWEYFLLGEDEDGYDDGYANTISDPSDLIGKTASAELVELYDALAVSWLGRVGLIGDRWDIATRYANERRRAMQPQRRSQWKAAEDETEATLVFYDADERLLRPEWMVLLGKNFDEFFIETTDDGSWTDGISVKVGQGDDADDNAIGALAPGLTVAAVNADWVEIDADEAAAAALWAGRFDDKGLLNRRYYLRVVDGSAAGEVYLVESVHRIGGTSAWSIRLAPNFDGTYPDIASDGLAADDTVSVFGPDIAIQCMDAASFAGYKRARIRIPSQKTYEGDYRLSLAFFGESVPLDATGRETSLFEWKHSISTTPHAELEQLSSGLEAVRYKSRSDARELHIQWAFVQAREMLANPISSALEAVGNDGLIVFLDEPYAHTGPTTPTDPHQVNYDPFVGFLSGNRVLSHVAPQLFNPYCFEPGVMGARVDVGSVAIKELG